jgi:hypothetical protein
MPFIVGSTTVRATAFAIRRIDCISALGECADSALRGERLGGCNAVCGENRQAHGAIVKFSNP